MNEAAPLGSGAAGRFLLAGERPINRLGFGAMRLTGLDIWAEPADRPAAIRLLQQLPVHGIALVDTADVYGPFGSEDLIAEALHPYDGLLIATKGGLVRYSTKPGSWAPVGDPNYLRQCVLMSMRRLKVDRIDLWQLHRIDPKVPRDEQFGAIAEMIDEGLIRYAGLSQVTIDDIEAARRVFPVATVQSRYNLADRSDEAVLNYCEAAGIGYIPWFPLAAGELARPGGPLDSIARARGASASQIALAWMLKRSPVMLPIPGTTQIAHLEENVAGATLQLSDEEFATLSATTALPST